ncbi:MAG TPA: riboflavin synthase [Saprospiraceae bacterium]|nr:riboflavin synthase [Saprospiraceae bacterium]HMP25625.1 riboflavin synthase [Saprospiraceae bacterium]
MFTGIIETLGIVRHIRHEGTNVHFTIESPIAAELKIDQSVAHNGVCLTVVAVAGDTHTVTAVEETLLRSNLGAWQEGSLVNLERAMLANARLDGHIVQGHVDATGECIAVDMRDGSWYYRFRFVPTEEHLLVDKGSVCVNGVSLTVVAPQEDVFSVAIIPYTYQHTTFKTLQPGDRVNLEFDIIGKYIARYARLYLAKG